MREVLNQSSDEEEDGDERTPDSSSPSLVHSVQSDFVMYQPGILPNIGYAPKHPTRSQIRSLYLAFMTNVEPVIKILHGPSLRRYFVEETGKLDCSPGPKGWDALKFAVYYTTTTSWTPEECLRQLGEEKAVLLPRFRSSTELALARADFINTEDMSTLQALLLYLVSHPPNLFYFNLSPNWHQPNRTADNTLSMLFEAMRILGALGH
jgi:hypothetical protein